MQVGTLNIYGKKEGMKLQQYSKPILDRIEREKKGMDYICTGDDKKHLHNLLCEISTIAGREIKYLAELDAFIIPNSGKIIAEYIYNFSSESVRAYLLCNLVAEKSIKCDKMVLDLYRHFKMSGEYISKSDMCAPSHIYARYDYAIKKLKPKSSKQELVELFHCPRDFFYLPQTMRMLASWKIPELLERLIQYSSDQNVTDEEIGLASDQIAYPSAPFMKREIRFTGIDCL